MTFNVIVVIPCEYVAFFVLDCCDFCNFCDFMTFHKVYEIFPSDMVLSQSVVYLQLIKAYLKENLGDDDINI